MGDEMWKGRLGQSVIFPHLVPSAGGWLQYCLTSDLSCGHFLLCRQNFSFSLTTFALFCDTFGMVKGTYKAFVLLSL